MACLTLRYCEDSATGLPRLEDPGGSLAPADLETLGREIDRHYERLIGSPDGQFFTLNGSDDPHLPRHFRVTVQDRNRRSPTLVLEAVETAELSTQENTPEAAPAQAPSPGSPGRWQVQFLAEVAELAARAPGDSATISSLDFVLRDLRALLRKDPDRFTLFLLAGYLHVGNALCLQYANQGENRYAQAARALAQAGAGSLPEAVLVTLLPPPHEYVPEVDPAPPPTEASWFRRFFSFR